MASALEKIEQELVGLMGDTGRSALKAALAKVRGGQSDMAFFNQVALVQELAKTFAMLMPENQLIRFKLKLLNLKGDDEL